MGRKESNQAKQIKKALIRLRGCAGWSAPMLLTKPEDRFSHVKAHILWAQAIFFPMSLKNRNDLKTTILNYSSLLGDNLSGEKNGLKWKMQ